MAILTTLSRTSTPDISGRSGVGSTRRRASSLDDPGSPSNHRGSSTAPPIGRNSRPELPSQCTTTGQEPPSNLEPESGKPTPRSRKSDTRPVSEWSNIELLSAFRDGNQPAFAELYRRHKAEIFTYCLRMMNGDNDAASDIFQEIFIRAYEKAGQFRAGSNVTGWLYMIARNMCLNSLRTKRPLETIELHPMLVSADRSLAPEYDEEQHFLRERLEEALRALPVEFREAFMLREFDGFSYSEIATMTGATLGMTKVRIYRAKQRMRELLAPFLER